MTDVVCATVNCDVICAVGTCYRRDTNRMDVDCVVVRAVSLAGWQAAKQTPNTGLRHPYSNHSHS